MKIILATGIYPPAIGGPATYVQALAGELVRKGMEVMVVTFGEKDSNPSTELRTGTPKFQIPKNSQFPNSNSQIPHLDDEWDVIRVSRSGGPLLRWWRYAKVLKSVGNNANAVIAFSSVSAGVPLWISRLKHPRKILRLGGDFLWERYTDAGGMKSLGDFYAWLKKWELGTGKWELGKWLMGKLLRMFDHIVFSTRFQEEIYGEHYDRLPPHSVIENALPDGICVQHSLAGSLKLLFMGRFVGFKNLPTLLQAVALQHSTPMRDKVTLTLAGEGPEKGRLERLSNALGIHKSVVFRGPVHGEEKERLFATHDLLVIPSLTEISPNVALEARSCGLPILLSAETGLSDQLTHGMILRDCSSSETIASALQEAHHQYRQLAADAAAAPLKRGWKEVAEEWGELVSSS